MKKLLVLFLAVATAGFAAGCGGGGDDDDDEYNFSGRWALRMVINDSNIPNTIGDLIGDVLIITQSGNNLTVRYESTGAMLTMVGTGDLKARTFTANGAGTGELAGWVSAMSGVGIDDDSMSGGFRWDFPGGRFSSGTWTADLGSRAMQAGGTGAGGVRGLVLKALQ